LSYRGNFHVVIIEEGIYSKEEYLSRKEKLSQKQKDLESEITILEQQLKKQDAVED
jgi:hypothetical protein